jgi:acetoin utilization protein AcuC
MKNAFIYTDKLSEFKYGEHHPLKPFRLKLTWELIKAFGLDKLSSTIYIEPKPADQSFVEKVHDHEYLDILRTVNVGIDVPYASMFGLGYGDNPIFNGVYEWSMLVAGATLEAVNLILSGEVKIAFNIAGGLHHALPNRASGFCYINDCALGIKYLLEKGKRVAYIDIDAHHGDGVQEIFYDNDDVLNISIHESGYYLFPGKGFVEELGTGSGYGYSINIPLPPGSDDKVFHYVFDRVVPAYISKFEPDIIVTQLGVDTLYDDPLAHLNLSIYGFADAVKKIKSFNLPWVALGGGGYNIASVAKAWTIAWAIINDVTLENKIPASYIETYRVYGFENDSLYGERYEIDDDVSQKLIKEVDREIMFLEKNLSRIKGKRVI